jgi:branched-chain amino acid aminotransferase
VDRKVIVFLNGRFLPAGQASVSIRDRGFLFADGVFETALLHDGGFFRLGRHLERFAESAALLRIAAPATAELDAIIRQLARDNGLRNAGIRITLTRGVAAPTLLVTATPPDPDSAERARRGWRLVTARTRRPSVASAPAQLKALGRTYAILARHEAADAGADDALLLTDAGHVCEGPSWNFFWRRDETLFTPSLDAGVLAGVTRSVLLELAPAAGLVPREGLFPRAELERADEVFVTMTSVGIVSVRALDGRSLPAATPAADRLRPEYLKLVAREAAADPL